MKKALTLLLVIAGFYSVQAQSIVDGGLRSVSNKGDVFFAEENYQRALAVYLQEAKAAKNDVDLQLKIAKTYKMLDAFETAEETYAKVIDGAPTEAKLDYAQVLAANNKPEQAKKYYEAYITEGGADPSAQRQLNALNNRDEYYFDSLRFDVQSMLINSGKSDFISNIYNDGILFLSTNDLRSADGNANFDLFYVKNNGATTSGSASSFSKVINSPLNEGSAAFIEGGNKIIFTRNDVAKKKKEGKNHLKLYSAVKSGDDWTDIKELPFSSGQYSVGHPTFNKAGTMMYFVSDMPGGHGGTDLYQCEYINGSWGDPQNLGAEINTESNEMFPFLQSDKYLFFSSNGYGGVGGLDVFKVRIDKEEKVVYNMGVQINSSRDDFGFMLDSSWEFGYLSSNRSGGKGGDDMYYFTIDIPETVRIAGQLIDGDKNPVPAVTVVAKENDEVIGTDVSDGDGRFAIDVPYGDHEYDVTMSGNTIANKSVTIEVDSSTFYLHPRIFEVDGQLIYEGYVTNKDTGERLEGVQITLTDIVTGEARSAVSDYDGKFSFPVESDRAYDITLKRDKFFSVTSRLVTNDAALKEAGNFTAEEIVVGKAIKLDNIYYDLGKATVRDDAKPSLENLVNILTENPTINIELSSHTDARGGASFNKSLSQRRAQSVVTYVVKAGISASRRRAKGYGESRLVNRCKDGVKCSEDEHQENRRTEFSVTKIN